MRAQTTRATDRLLLAVLAVFLGVPGFGAEESQNTSAAAASTVAQHIQAPEIQLRGRVVCLPEEMHRLYQTDLPTNHEHSYGFKTTNGTYHTLLRTKLSEALFADRRLRERELLLTGRVLPGTQIFDASGMKSIRNGVVHDLYYYCDLCAIRTVVPGPCMCCQAPVELVEKPLDRESR